jgi:hypothetical protein
MIVFRDKAEIKGAARITPEGYFVADALVARANNIQEYRAGELGLTDRAADSLVRVFRPEAEVFAADSLATAAHLPITMDHPPVMVDASNWREYSRGDTDAQVLRDGEFIRIPLRVTDAAAVTSVRTDRKEFSLGYSADLKLEAGVFDGQAYDASVTNLRYNHLAACRAARGGPELRIIDERPEPRQPEGTPMPHIVVVDGLPVDVSNPETAATVVKSAITARDTANGALEASQTALATANQTIAARDAEIVTLKDAAENSKLTPQQLRDAAGDYARTVATAKALGATVTDAMDAQAVRAAAVAHKMPTATFATDAETNAAFAVLAAGVKPADVTDAAADPLRAMLADGQPATQGDASKAFNDARAARFARYENAHLGDSAAAAQ